MDVLSAMWDSASADLAAEQRSRRLVAAKVSAAEVWPFLALASTEPEFEHRLALVRDHVEAVVDPDLQDAVLASLREDFRITAGYGDGKWDDETAERAQRSERDQASVNEIMQTKKYPDTPYRAYDADDSMARHEETNPGIFDRGMDKIDEQTRRHSSSTPAPQRRKLDPDDPIDAQRIKQRRLDQAENSGDDEGDRYWDQHHKSSLRAATSASLWDNLGEAPARHQQHVAAAAPPEPMFFHAGRGEWVRLAAAQESPGNPLYPDTSPEVGPQTGWQGYNANPGDPQDNALQRYVNPEGGWAERTPWVENPMSFSPPENGTSGWTTPPMKTSARTAAGPLSGGPMNWGESGPGGGLNWEHNGEHEAFGLHPETGEEMAHVSPPVGQRRPMLHYYPDGGKTRERDEMHAHVDHKDEGIARANYHYDQQQMQRQGSRRRRTATRPTMDPQDAETRAHVCAHCGEEEPEPSHPCKENGAYCSGCGGSGCGRCAGNGEVFGPHKIMVGVKRHADVDHAQQSNPDYFGAGSEGVTGPGAETAPPPITGNPDAGVVGGGPDGSTTSEPIEARSDWYQEMTGQADSPEQDGTEGQGFKPQAARGRRPFVQGRYTVDEDHNVRGPNGDVKGHHDSDEEAREQQKALYANTKDARRSSFFDPHDASVRVTADADPEDMGASASPGLGAGGVTDAPQNTPQVDTTGGTNPGQDPNARVNDIEGMSSQAVRIAVRRALGADQPGGASGPSAGGSSPPPPPSMAQGGPGAEAVPPQQGAGGAGAPGGAGGPGSAGNVPQTTKPRNMPGGGGAPGAPGGGGPGTPGGVNTPQGHGGTDPTPPTSGGSPGTPKAGRRVRADSRNIESPDDPTGMGDEFRAQTVEKQMAQKPRQDAESRGSNTPQNTKAQEAIPTVSSDSPGMPEEADDDDDNTREAVRRALAMVGVR